ncbi:hypothetical protein [Naasia aerilata]|uniref:DUF1206 domain-containing protein n=1 Tax=Naasia aerilata TaxID=1162966 RepID=A0ABN6XKV0_9MICO|nr:hypothetical protein [Naasia aerilata]BDZ45489.1 hypothetical protein GCM10025866_13980 [Naasia aerilata]
MERLKKALDISGDQSAARTLVRTAIDHDAAKLASMSLVALPYRALLPVVVGISGVCVVVGYRVYEYLRVGQDRDGDGVYEGLSISGLLPTVLVGAVYVAALALGIDYGLRRRRERLVERALAAEQPMEDVKGRSHGNARIPGGAPPDA